MDERSPSTSCIEYIQQLYGLAWKVISAVAWGTESCSKVEKIFGPGNQYVTAEKMILQAEHGPDCQVVLAIARDGVDLRAIEEEIGKQYQDLTREEFASKARSHSYTVFVCDMMEAVSFSNMYAPEHLIVNVQDAEKWECFIENAGFVFLGPWTPECVGDYASGTNHVLPTSGYARMYGVVSFDSFLKYTTAHSLIEKGLKKLGPYIATIAEVEGLEAH